MKFKILLGTLLITSTLLVAKTTSNFQCNNEIINDIYYSFKVLSKKINKKPLKTNNVELINIKIKQKQHQIIKTIKILDENLTNKIETNKLYKDIALSLQQNKLCKKYNSDIGKCFLDKNSIIINYLDKKGNYIGTIVLNKNTCNLKK